MIAIQKAIDDFQSLDDVHKEEVIDFIEFLKQKENKRIEEVADEIFREYDKVFKDLSKPYFSKSNTTIDGELEIQHSNIFEDNYLEMIVIYFRRDNCYAEFLLPNRVWLKIDGFNNEELVAIREYAVRNEVLIWDLAREMNQDK